MHYIAPAFSIPWQRHGMAISSPNMEAEMAWFQLICLASTMLSLLIVIVFSKAEKPPINFLLSLLVSFDLLCISTCVRFFVEKSLISGFWLFLTLSIVALIVLIGFSIWYGLLMLKERRIMKKRF